MLLIVYKALLNLILPLIEPTQTLNLMLPLIRAYSGTPGV